MDLLDQLVAYYGLEERFDEDINAWNSVAPNAYTLNHGGASSVTGKVALGANTSEGGLSISSGDGDPIYQLGVTDKTFALWFKVDSVNPVSAFQYVFFRGLDYFVRVDETDNTLELEIFVTVAPHPTVLELDRWYFLVVTHRVSDNFFQFRLNDGAPVTGTALPFVGHNTFVLGDGLDGAVDEFGVWNRILTGAEMDWLYNDGNGRSYDEIVEESSPGNCRELTCCSD